MNQELVKQKSDMLASESKGIVNPSLKVQYEDTYSTLQHLQFGEEKLCSQWRLWHRIRRLENRCVPVCRMVRRLGCNKKNREKNSPI